VTDPANVVPIQGSAEGAATLAPEIKHTAALCASEDPLPSEFVQIIQAIEKELQLPVWLLIQQGDENNKWDWISEPLYSAFMEAKDTIESGKPVALLLHTPGGLAEEGFKIIRLFQRRTDKFMTIVPAYAKSAATMMALGGRAVLMGGEAELGPLDVQILEEEGPPSYDSALNAVQSLERLNAYALTALDQAMALFVSRTRKKPESLLPAALQYATSMIGPLVGKIDSVALTKKSRALKVAEDYAIRLMKEAGYSFAVAKRIANALVERYSTHGFVIDFTEAKALEQFGTEQFGLGLNVKKPSASMQQQFDELQPYLDKLTVIGRLQEVEP
jgi:hypothetical protein